MKQPKGSLNARRTSTLSAALHGAERAARATPPHSAVLALAGYDFTEFAAFLRANDPVWVRGERTRTVALRSAKKGGPASR